MLIKVIIDYKGLKYFMITKKLTKYQACQAKFLLGFNFIILYIPSKENPKSDLLTHYVNNLSIDKNNDYQQYQL